MQYIFGCLIHNVDKGAKFDKELMLCFFLCIRIFRRVPSCIIAYCHVFFNALWCLHISHKDHKGIEFVNYFFTCVFNRPGVAGAVLQTPPSFIDSLSQ